MIFEYRKTDGCKADNKNLFVGLLLFFGVVNIEFLNSRIYTLILYLCLLVVLFFVFRNRTSIPKTKYDVLAAVAIIGIGIFTSAFINRVELFYIRAAAYYGVYLVAVFAFLTIMAQCEDLEAFFRVAKGYLLVLLLINDILMLAIPGVFYNIHERDIGTCLLGNKFSVAYAHLLYVFLTCYLEKNTKIRILKTLAMTGFMTAVFTYIDCVTAMLGVWFFAFLIVFHVGIRKILVKRSVFFAFFALAALLLVILPQIISLAPVKWIIVNVLHRDPTLTGRLEAFSYIFELVPSHLWLGYGYGTSIVKISSTWYANVQNAFWDFIIRYGLVTMLVLSFLCFRIIGKSQRVFEVYEQSRADLWPWIAILYTWVFMGMGEIVYDIYFFFYLAGLNAICSPKNFERDVRNNGKNTVNIRNNPGL